MIGLFSLLVIILIEGFVTVSVEILSIRQLTPVAGNSVIVTSLIIGIFLLFLAAGYHRGGHVKENYADVLKRNFTFAAIWLGIGLSFLFIAKFFALLSRFVSAHMLFSLGAYLLLITAPVVYVLGQTVPITTNLFKFEHHVGTISGRVLGLSTLGSFFGAVLTSLLLMNYFGVAWSVYINFLFLILLILLLVEDYKREFPRLFFLCLAAVVVYVLNMGVEQQNFVKTTNYANYRVFEHDMGAELGLGKVLSINGSGSSFINNKGQGFPYIELIKRILFQDLQLRNKTILVLGAGGFSLSAENTYGNHFVYNDIDPEIKPLAEKHFINNINGRFVVGDARSYLLKHRGQYEVIVSDVYSHRASIPYHLVTREYFRDVRKALKPGGIALFNIIANPELNTRYAKRVDNTIRSVFNSCMAIPIVYSNKPTNIIYVCKLSKQNNDKTIYTDNLNSATIDNFNR